MIRRLFDRARDPEDRRIRAWCRKTLGINPGLLPLYREALRHVSAVPEDREDLPDNERMEFLGDSILDAIIGDLLFKIYKDKDEGFLTRMRSKLVSRTQLNLLAKRMEIERVLESNVAKDSTSSVPGNALEALIGAIFLDKGFDRTRKIVVGLLEEHFDLKEIEKEDRDGKSRLLEWGQKRKKRIDLVIHEENTGRGKRYLCEVRINGELKGTGSGPSKKTAEQDAAQSAFRSMRSRRHQPSRLAAQGQTRPAVGSVPEKPSVPRKRPAPARHSDEAPPAANGTPRRRSRGRRKPRHGGASDGAQAPI